MQPKNTKERRNSFLKFLLLFILTSGTIVTAVFFTFKVPLKENTVLKTKVKKIDFELKFQDAFYDRMSNVKKMLDSLETPGSNTNYINLLIGKDLADMQESIPTKDSTYKYDMYSNVITLFLDMQTMKRKLKRLQHSENTIEEYKEALEKSRAEFQQLERDLILARSQS